MAEDFSEQIRRVKEANDIVEVVSGYLNLRAAGSTHKGLCPFHDDRHPSLDVDPKRQRFRCWACGKYGDVITFVQEYDRVSFLEALELLARRAGISLKKTGNFRQDSDRAGMLEVVRWAEQQFHRCLLDSFYGEAARHYLGERKLSGETIRKYGLGFAPGGGDWLYNKAQHEGVSREMLLAVGLIAQRKEGKGYYDRFRERIIFPIRDVLGRSVAFGGRILPNSSSASPGPKYYNSCDTPLFNKSEFLYGLDQAKQAAAKAGYLAVVEGYTDVLMAHQTGVLPVVATMGTALNSRHVRHFRRFAGNVILVFDADAGGTTGVDRALEIVVRHDVSLKIATLPQDLDPYDVFVQKGAQEFQSILTNAQDVLDFKLDQVWQGEAQTGLEGRRRAVDRVLRVIAIGPALSRGDDQLKRELMMTRISQRFGIKEETLWTRLKELRKQHQIESTSEVAKINGNNEADMTAMRQAPAMAHEKQLLEILLSEPKLVAQAAREIPAGQIEHPGVRQLVEGMYRLLAEGEEPSLDNLRSRIDNPPLMAKALELQENGLACADRSAWYNDILNRFQELKQRSEKQKLHQQLHSAGDHAAAVELLKQLRNRTSG